jgi:hypothetical protein
LTSLGAAELLLHDDAQLATIQPPPTGVGRCAVQAAGAGSSGSAMAAGYDGTPTGAKAGAHRHDANFRVIPGENGQEPRDSYM